MSKKTLLVAVLILVIVAIIAAAVYKNQSNGVAKKENENNLEKIKVQAGWILNGEFANVCSAIVNGYYKEEGLDVELIPGGPSGGSFVIATNAIAQNNDLDIAIDGDLVPLLRGRTKDDNEQLKVKAFASFWNDIPYGFIVREDSGLNSLKDLATKRKADGSKYKIGVTADSVIQQAIAKYADVPVENLDIVIVGYDATPFLAGQVDALAAYWTTQAYEVEKAGIPYKFLSVSEMPGFSQPSQIALATEEKLRTKHDSLVKWLRATIKGSKFVIENPEEASKQILDPRCGGPSFDANQEEWLIKKSLPLFDKDKIGWIDKDKVTGYSNAYFNLGQIPRPANADELVDYSILNEIYK
ncbi:MAG: ABC transporter substrate-binding protein [Candidatus Moraniibacteriota bacterium]